MWSQFEAPLAPRSANSGKARRGSVQFGIDCLETKHSAPPMCAPNDSPNETLARSTLRLDWSMSFASTCAAFGPWSAKLHNGCFDQRCSAQPNAAHSSPTVHPQEQLAAAENEEKTTKRGSADLVKSTTNALRVPTSQKAPHRGVETYSPRVSQCTSILTSPPNLPSSVSKCFRSLPPAETTAAYCTHSEICTTNMHVERFIGTFDGYTTETS